MFTNRRYVVLAGLLLLVAFLAGTAVADATRNDAHAAQTDPPKAGDQCTGNGVLSMQAGYEMFAMTKGNSEGLYLNSDNSGACYLEATVSCAITIEGAEDQFGNKLFKPVETKGPNNADPCPLIDPEVKGVYDPTATHVYTVSSPEITWTQSDGTPAVKQFVLGEMVLVHFLARGSYLVMAQPLENALPGTNNVPGTDVSSDMFAGILSTNTVTCIAQWYDVPPNTNVATAVFDGYTVVKEAWSPIIHNDTDDSKDRYATLVVEWRDESKLNEVRIHAPNYGTLPTRLMVCGQANQVGVTYMTIVP